MRGDTYFGGGEGIRTPVPVKANGFQDRLVMTASIRLRIRGLKASISIPYRAAKVNFIYSVLRLKNALTQKNKQKFKKAAKLREARAAGKNFFRRRRSPLSRFRKRRVRFARQSAYLSNRDGRTVCLY